MNMDTVVIPVLAVGAIYLPIIGIWAYQTFALKHQLREVEERMICQGQKLEERMHDQINEVERRLYDSELRTNERMNRIEARMDQIQSSLNVIGRDLERAIGRVEGKIQ